MKTALSPGENIEFPKQYNPKDFYSLGRNGHMQTSGITLWSLSDSVFIQPLSSKGKTGRCYLKIPKDRGFLLSLAEAITRIANGEVL